MRSVRQNASLRYGDMEQQVAARRDGALTRMLIGQTSIAARHVPKPGMDASSLIARKLDLLNREAILDYLKRYGKREL